MIAKQNPSEKERWPLTALSETVQELARQKSNLAEYAKRGTAESQVISKVMPWFAKAREIAVDLASAEADRVLAIRILGRGIDHRMEDLAMLASLVSPRQPRDVQFASLDSLEKMNTPDVSRLLLSNWKQQSPAVQSQIVLVMLSRMIWTQDLLNAIEDNQITGRDLNATERQRLLTHSDAGIAMRAAKALSNQLTENRQKVLADYSSVLELNGDNARGSEIFKKSCAACHKYRGQGNQLGANLATLQDRSTKALLTAILDPNLAVEGKFRSYTAILKDGRILSGMIIEESSSNITLVASNGISQTLLRNDIDEFKSSGLSFMPEGVEKDLKPQDVADVIAFLQLNPGLTK